MLKDLAVACCGVETMRDELWSSGALGNAYKAERLLPANAQDDQSIVRAASGRQVQLAC